MSEHERSHPQWEVPPAGYSPDPGTVPAAEPPAASTREASSHHTATVGSSPEGRRRGWRRTTRPASRRGRGLVAAAVGFALLLAGGAGGFALAADDGPDRGDAVTVTVTDDGNDTDGGDGRPDRGGVDRARGDLVG